MQETWVRSLGQKDPLEKGMAVFPSLLLLNIPVFLPGEPHGQRSLEGYSPWGHKEPDTTEQLTLSLHFHFTGGKPEMGYITCPRSQS